LEQPPEPRVSIAPPALQTNTTSIPAPSASPRLQGTFGVLPEELPRTAVLAAMLFVCSCVFVLGRTVRDALFLSHYGARVASALPWMFIAYGVTSAAVAVVYARVASRLARPTFVSALAVTVAAAYACAWVGIRFDPPWLYPALYVGSEIAGNLLVAQFWAVANDLHDPRSAKRLFGIIGVGRIVGIVVCGLGAGSFVAAVGTDNLLLALSALTLVVVAFVWWLVRDFSLPRIAPEPKGGAPASVLAPVRSPYLRAVALVVLIGFVVVNVGDFQFKAAARLAHPSRDELALFMARYYATVGVIAMGLQLFVTRPLLSRFGVGGGLLALPLAYGAANLVLLAMPGVFAATVVKLSDNAVQFTVFEATLQLLYFPLDDRERDSARAALEAAVKPLGYAAAGAIVLGLAAFVPPSNMQAIARQSWFVLPLIGGWLLAVRVVRKRYVAALERSLLRRPTVTNEPPVDEAAARDALVKGARDGHERAACFAIERLAEVSPTTAVAEAARWLARKEPSVRIATIRAIAQMQRRELAPLLAAAIDDPDEKVAAEAVTATGALHGEHCVALLEARLSDPRPSVEQAAVVTMLRFGALEGALIAGKTLETWLRSKDTPSRLKAASVLGTEGVPGALRVVRALLEDEEVAVRRAALRATASSGIALAPEAIRAMDDPALRAAAIEAVVRMGDAVVPMLDARLSDPRCPRDVRLNIPRVLAQIATTSAYEVLLSRVDEADEWLRQKVLASASRLRRSSSYYPLDERVVLRRMNVELDELERQINEYERARVWLGMVVLDRWMIERIRKGFLRVLRLAELSSSGGRRVEPTREAVFSRDVQRRARALEVLDDVLVNAVAQRFAKALDRWLAMRESPLGEPSGARPAGMTGFVARLFALPERFAKVLALDAVQFRSIDIAPESVAEALAHSDPTVREFALLVEVTFKREGWRERVSPLLEDEDDFVRSYVRFALETGSTGMSPEDEMFTTLEKVLFLHRVEVFSEVAPEDLMGLARSASVERHSKGAVLFRVGDPGLALYLVIDGKVRTKTAAGIMQEYGEGEAFGELAVLDASVRSDDAEVIDDATVLKIAREDFVEVVRENGPLAEAVIRVLVRRLRALRKGEG
jgi:ATP/ADP translocase/HEAT repeat protein